MRCLAVVSVITPIQALWRQLLSWVAIMAGTVLLIHLNVFKMPWSLMLPLLVWTAYTDAKYRIIPNTVPLALLLYGVYQDPNTAIGGLFGCFFIFLPMYALGVMGGGDVKLAASVGAIMGYYHGVEVVAYSNAFALIYLIIKKLKTRQLKVWLHDSMTALKNLKYGIKPDIPDNEDALHKETVPLGAFFLPGVIVLMYMIGGV